MQLTKEELQKVTDWLGIQLENIPPLGTTEQIILKIVMDAASRNIDMPNRITPSEYAESRGITLQAVTKQIRSGGPLPGIKSVEKFGRYYLLIPENN